MGFPEYLDSIVSAPLRGPIGSKLIRGFGQSIATLYGKGGKVEQAVHARMPTYQNDPSSLPVIGADRLIDRGFQESDASYGLRLKQAWDSWRHAGSAVSVLQAELAYVTPSAPLIRIVHSTTFGGNTYSTWGTIPAGSAPGTLPFVNRVTPANWDWDGVLTEWWRTWVIIYPPTSLWTANATWGDGGRWGDGRVWGFSGLPGEAASMAAILRKWRAKQTWSPWIILSFDASYFNPFAAAGDASLPDGNWGHWSKVVNNQRVPSRFANARYLDGDPKADQTAG